MPLRAFDRQLPDPDPDAPLWRFMKLTHFQDLMANEELYFHRDDLYVSQDPQDGIPSDDYARSRLGLRRYDVMDEVTLIDQQGENRSRTAMFYLSCWSLRPAGYEMRMWSRDPRPDVAVITTFGRLRSAVDAFLDEMHMGVVRYGHEEMTGYNALQFLFTKGTRFSWESEVRIAIRHPRGLAGDSWVHEYKRRRLRLDDVLTGIQISPWASPEIASLIREWARLDGRDVPVYDCASSLIPSPEEFARHLSD